MITTSFSSHLIYRALPKERVLYKSRGRTPTTTRVVLVQKEKVGAVEGRVINVLIDKSVLRFFLVVPLFLSRLLVITSSKYYHWVRLKNEDAAGN